ncbi:MAG: hypothetical protein AB9Q22_10270 [Candidatus Reddybacter sp.]
MKKLFCILLLLPTLCWAGFDRTDPADLLALKTEVNSDPLGFAYNAATGDTGLVLSTVNLARAQFVVSKPSIAPGDVRATCTYDAYNNLSIDEQEWIRWMTGSGGNSAASLVVTVDLRLRLTDAEGSGTGSIWAAADRAEMNQAMLDLIDVAGSRAENLFGYGTVISRADWIAARDS